MSISAKCISEQASALPQPRHREWGVVIRDPLSNDAVALGVAAAVEAGRSFFSILGLCDDAIRLRIVRVVFVGRVSARRGREDRRKGVHSRVEQLCVRDA
jgi:hypothetical protein